LKFFDVLGCSMIGPTTYFYYQKKLLFPAVYDIWKEKQSNMFSLLEAYNEPLSIGGDARCDSPGFSARFIYRNRFTAQCSYGCSISSGMCVHVYYTISLKIIQSNEVRGSSKMELEGFIRAMRVLEENNLEVGLLVTDRHLQVQKWVREEMPYVVHKFDMWRVAKCIISHTLLKIKQRYTYRAKKETGSNG
jgi:solute carrier family 8 (sodium/calcium exchanger)